MQSASPQRIQLRVATCPYPGVILPLITSNFIKFSVLLLSPVKPVWLAGRVIVWQGR